VGVTRRGPGVGSLAVHRVRAVGRCRGDQRSPLRYRNAHEALQVRSLHRRARPQVQLPARSFHMSGHMSNHMFGHMAKMNKKAETKQYARKG
jgi:hypothetical protein